jgi:hypothetical protein
VIQGEPADDDPGIFEGMIHALRSNWGSKWGQAHLPSEEFGDRRVNSKLHAEPRTTLWHAGRRSARSARHTSRIVSRECAAPARQTARRARRGIRNQTATTTYAHPGCRRSAEDGSSRVPLPGGQTPRPFAVRVPRGPNSTPPHCARGTDSNSRTLLSRSARKTPAERLASCCA